MASNRSAIVHLFLICYVDIYFCPAFPLSTARSLPPCQGATILKGRRYAQFTGIIQFNFEGLSIQKPVD